MRRILLSAIFVFAGSGFIFPAEETSVSFVIAPPPVGYPVFEANTESLQAGGSLVYLSTDFGSEDLTVVGGQGSVNWQRCLTDRFATNGSVVGALLAGDLYNLFILQFPVNLNLVYEPVKRGKLSLFVFGGGGLNMGRSRRSRSCTR